MVLQILLCHIDLGPFLMTAVRSIILTIFIPAVTSSIMVIRALGSPMMLTRLFGYLFLLVVLPMVIDYFNACTHAHSLGIASVLFGYLLKNTRLCHERRKSLKTSNIYLFLLDFIL
jgi:hypothetical protein